MSALNTQIGGDHYKGKAIQPIEYISANNLNFAEGAIVKYISRWRDKNGYEDLLKIKHYVDLLIEMEKKYGKRTNTEHLSKPSTSDPFADVRCHVLPAEFGRGGWGVIGADCEGEKEEYIRRFGSGEVRDR